MSWKPVTLVLFREHYSPLVLYVPDILVNLGILDWIDLVLVVLT